MLKKTFILPILILAFAASIFAQEKTAAKTTEWVRVENETGEFSVELPSDFTYFYDQDGFSFENPSKTYSFKYMQMLNAAADKTVMSVEIYRVSSPKTHLEELLDRQRFSGEKSEESKNGLTIKQFTQNKYEEYRTKKETEVNFVAKFIASKTHIYVVTVANRGAASPTAMRFLSSIRLNAKSSDTEKIIQLSSLKPLTIEQIGETVKDEVKLDKPQTTKPIEKPENPIIILNKPQVTYTEAARQTLTSGSIRLRVTFDKNGAISKIGLLKGLPNGLNRNAFFAALRIKFIPQEKENELETVTKTVEYSFSIG
jgi:TonB family protein